MLKNIVHTPADTLVFAKELRRSMTDAEKILWSKLRVHRFFGYKFRRQVPLGPYIVDFFCPDRSIIIELDGSGHAEQEAYDKRRDAYFFDHNLLVVRFWNHEVFENMEGVLEIITTALRVHH